MSGKDKRKKALTLALRLVVPVVVSVGLCLVMFRDIDFAQMMQLVRTQCDFRWIALMLGMSLLPMVFRGLRWGIQLHALGIDVPVRILVYSVFGTYAVNLVFPRLGEVWRTGYVAQRQKAPFSEVFGSMVADRLADTALVALLTLFTFVGLRGPIVAFMEAYPGAYLSIKQVLFSPWTWMAVAATLFAGWLLWRRGRRRGADAGKPQGLAAKVWRFLRGLWQGFAALGRMRHKGQWLALTAALWGCYFLQLYVAFYSFPVTSELLSTRGLEVVLVCFVLTSLSMGVPSNGGIGPYQTTMIFGLSLFMPPGADAHLYATESAAFANVVMAAQTAFLVILGLVTFALIAFDRYLVSRRGSRGAS